jgi:tRNA dimethylallyltransferase
MSQDISIFDFLKNCNKPTLLVITGPTAVGKSDFAIQVADYLNTSIISADSRQFYKELKIGTAAPSMEDLNKVPHYFIGHLSIMDYYSVSKFEQDVLSLLPSLFEKSAIVIMTGGSGLYIDAVCKGIDDLPDCDLEIRSRVINQYKEGGIEELRRQIKFLDPDFYQTSDIANHKRLMRAIEVSLQTGKPYSSFLKAVSKTRFFNIHKYCLVRNRKDLFERINHRVDLMMEIGLLNEVKSLYKYKDHNALNTVGYKELFDYLDGKCTLEEAISDIKTDTRRYAKRQMTWFKRDGQYEEIILS